MAAAATTCSSFDAAFTAEIGADLWLVEANCRSLLGRAFMQQFGPPTPYEVSQVMCRGDCRDLQDRITRLATYTAATGCSCVGSVASGGRCPRSPAQLMCAAYGLCVDGDAYHAETCAATACGRWETNEAAWRAARKACQLADGAASSALSAAAALAAVAAVVVHARPP